MRLPRRSSTVYWKKPASDSDWTFPTAIASTFAQKMLSISKTMRYSARCLRSMRTFPGTRFTSPWASPVYPRDAGADVRFFRQPSEQLQCSLKHLGALRSLHRNPRQQHGEWSIIPVQDLLGLGADARINTPGQVRGNWVWCMTEKQFDALPVKRLLEMTTTFGRV